jgi:glucose/arabinose dehydrogenase
MNRHIFAFLCATLGLVTLSGVAAGAEVLPFKLAPAFGNVAFKQPVQVVFAPGETSRAFVVELDGCIAVVRDVEHPKREVFLDLTKRVGPQRDGHGPLSMAFHPKFAENGIFFVWFSTSSGRERATCLARFKLSATNPGVADPASETILLTQSTGRGGHDGCELQFGADGYLYVSIGDGDEHESECAISHQRIDRSFFGAILRLDVDRKSGSLAPNPHPSVHAGTYAVPPDNPFVGAKSFNGASVDPTKVRTEFWAVGLRNPWRMAFDSATGRLWCGDVGLHEHEEIDVITRGGNYGWDYREGVIAGPHRRPPAGVNFIEPIWDYAHPEGISITGGFVYHGKMWPELEGKYLFADYGIGQVWALDPDGDKPVKRDRVRQIAKDIGGLVALTSDPGTGDVLLTNIAVSRIERLVRNPAAK